MPAKAMTVDRLREFSDHWDRADLTRVMSFFTPDCVFQPSVEHDPAAAFVGHDAVSAEIARIFARDGGYPSSSGAHLVFGSYGYSEWFLTIPHKGRDALLRGCDFFEFEGDLIKRKDAFRKQADWIAR